MSCKNQPRYADQDVISRRSFLYGATGTSLTAGVLLPRSGRSGDTGNGGTESTYRETNLIVARTKVTINGRTTSAVTVNGTLPGPLLRWTEGDEVVLNVMNRLNEDTSIHWHGLLLPNAMDGVPGVTFGGIKPQETFSYRFKITQSGTYWYHSHSGFQEQLGHYGPIIIDPVTPETYDCDRDYVILLSDWLFEDPHRIFAELKKMSGSLDYQKRTLLDFVADVKSKGMSSTLKDRLMWGEMRMSPTDISDVTGAQYQYLINGRGRDDNWTGIFRPGERVRLRFINAAAMTFFNIRIPGLAMTVVQADGQDIAPVEIDEFQIGVAETYDVIVQPAEQKPYVIYCEAIDRSGYCQATLAPDRHLRGVLPEKRTRPLLSMAAMGMQHASHPTTDGVPMEDSVYSQHHHASGDTALDSSHTTQQGHAHETGPGVANLPAHTRSRLHEPGIGLEHQPHRTLTYDQLKSRRENTKTIEFKREIELHLTGNMERYMWSFDGVKFSDIAEPIVLELNSHVRLTLVNDTMMPHPIHLHGMFFQLVNGQHENKPNKHTVIVKPAEKLSLDLIADVSGDWAFHCHMLFHMHAGMFRIISVRPDSVS